MPDYELFIATDEVARAGGAVVEAKWLPEWRPGQFGPDPAPDSDRIPSAVEPPDDDLWRALGGDGMVNIVDAWECIYGGESPNSDGPWVYRMPENLVDRLAALAPEQIRPTAEAWAETETFRDFKPVLVPEPILAGLVRLLRQDRKEPQRRQEVARIHGVEEFLIRIVHLVQRAKRSGKGVYVHCEL